MTIAAILKKLGMVVAEEATEVSIGTPIEGIPKPTEVHTPLTVITGKSIPAEL